MFDLLFESVMPLSLLGAMTLLHSLRIREWGQSRSTLLVASIKSTYAPFTVQPHTASWNKRSHDMCFFGVALRRR